MQFLFPTLTIGFALLAVPFLVHLINVLRQRRRQWAAMDFLLASYRKQRKWIWLRQLLLLLMRTAVVAVLVAMLAGWAGRAGWLDALGGQTNHHIVLLDDSLSMSDQSGGGSAYRRALSALQALGERLAIADGTHQLTVIRTSRAELVVGAGSKAGDAAADLSAQTVGAENRALDRLMATSPSSLAGGMGQAVELAAGLAEATSADRTILYVLSDLRQHDWESPERINASLQELSKSGTEIRMVDCATTPAANLALTQLQPVEDVWVAGVPVMVEATVRNYGTETATNVTLDAKLIRYGREVAAPRTDQLYSGPTTALPAMVFEKIEPGKQVTKQFQVYVAEPGTHGLTVSIPEDIVTADNTRTCTLPLIDQQKVLIVDGDAEGSGAYFVASVLNPGGQVRTGAIPEIRPVSFLNSVRSEELAQYRVLYLLNLHRIEDSVARMLNEYVTAGGGLALFLGDATDRENYNRLIEKYPGLLPGTLNAAKDLPLPSGSETPDLLPDGSHPIIAPLAAAGEGALGLVRVVRSLGLETDRDLALSVRTVIRRRDDLPFAVEHRLGKGRVVTVLTDLGNNWTNWTGDPTFVVFLLRTNAFLWSTANPATSRNVIEPLALRMRNESYGRSVDLIAAADAPPRLSIQLQAEPDAENQDLELEVSPAAAAIDGSIDVATLLQPGIFEWWLTRLDGSREVRPVASVIADGEGDLRRAPRSEIDRALRPTMVTFFDAGQMASASESESGRRTGILLALLAAMMVGEQVLGYFGSYHPPLRAKA
ncbi:BatA domain-containing protein [Rosistilla oblonga]|uniref:BatA domain-containing protein n=1 Tax=Rosistilla oblonga TaxID=2527990 RepID=UPI003A97B26A